MMIDDFLQTCRDDLDRVVVGDLGRAIEAGAIVVDIRPIEWRERNGEMPGAHIIDRNVLLWRLSPTSETRSMDLGPDSHVILFCNDGFASSVAARQLHDVGVPALPTSSAGTTAGRPRRPRQRPDQISGIRKDRGTAIESNTRSHRRVQGRPRPLTLNRRLAYRGLTKQVLARGLSGSRRRPFRCRTVRFPRFRWVAAGESSHTPDARSLPDHLGRSRGRGSPNSS